MIFRGTFEHALDAKHRLTVPAKFRAQLADKIVLAASFERRRNVPRSVGIWTAEAYDRYTKSALEKVDPLSPEATDLRVFLYGLSHDTELDSANRVMIPQSLMEYAQLDKDVVVTSRGDCLLVFDRGRYGEYLASVLLAQSDSEAPDTDVDTA